MTVKRIFCYLTLSLLFSITLPPAQAQNHSNPAEQLIGQIIQDVVVRTSEAAAAEVNRHLGIDPLKRGYNLNRQYAPLPASSSEESRRELQQLAEEHNRKMSKLQEELDRKLDHARAEFEREAAKEDKPEKIKEKRNKLQKKVDEAYAKFDEKTQEENQRFDRKRDKIFAQAK